MTKEQEIIDLLLEKAEELAWLEGVRSTFYTNLGNSTAKIERHNCDIYIDDIFYTNLGNSTVKIERYNCDIYIDDEYIGVSRPLEDKITKIRSEIKAKQRDKTLDPVLNFLKGNLR